MLRFTLVAVSVATCWLEIGIISAPAQVISVRKPDGTRYETNESYWNDQFARFQGERNRLDQWRKGLGFTADAIGREKTNLESASSRLNQLGARLDRTSNAIDRERSSMESARSRARTKTQVAAFNRWVQAFNQRVVNLNAERRQ
jgi:hypothetical protein